MSYYYGLQRGWGTATSFKLDFTSLRGRLGKGREMGEIIPERGANNLRASHAG